VQYALRFTVAILRYVIVKGFFMAAGLASLVGGSSESCIAASSNLEPISRTVSNLEAALETEANGVAGGHVTPVWLKDGSRFLFSENEPTDLSIFLADPRTGRLKRLTRDEELRKNLAQITGLPAEQIVARIDGLSQDERTLYLQINTRFVALNIVNQSVSFATDYAHDVQNTRQRLISDQFPTTYGDLTEACSPDGRSFITVQNNNLFARSSLDGSLRQLTQDGKTDLTWLSTEESAQSLNVFWSPDSLRIAAVQLDTRGVWREPLMHWLEPHSRADLAVFPRAGETMPGFRLAVIEANSGTQTPIDTGDTSNHYVNLLGWRADGKVVFYQVFDREQKRVDFFSADALSGARKLLFAEQNSTYVDTRMTLGMDFFYPLRKSNGFLFLSDRDGWRHIYRYDADGTSVAELTHGVWPVEQIVSVDESGGWIYFRASRDSRSPYDLQLFRVALDGSRIEQLTSGKGAHSIAMAPSNQFFLSTRAGPDLPPSVDLYASNGRLIKALTRARIDSLLQAGFGGVEEFSAIATDGSSVMQGMLVRPYHFDSSKRYPIIEIIYGGMQAINVSHDSFAASGMGSASIVTALTNAGFAVAILDAPGTPGRGKRFQDATYGTWPSGVIANHVRWLEAAGKAHSWIDLSQVGIYGHSWGGYMAEIAMVEAPNFFKAAVSHAAPADLIDHSTYIEPFLGLPNHNPHAYESGSVLSRVNALAGPMLIMQMPLDANAGFSPGMKLTDALIHARKDFELFIAPSSNHRMNCCGREQELYQVAVVQRYFRDHLGAAATATQSEAR
jgi:dipeptidyl aminopeptidase/acylaminoacyl peptidase